MPFSLIEQYKICLERGHDTSHAVGRGGRIDYRCKFCGTTFCDDVIRREVHYHEEVYPYIQGLKETKHLSCAIDSLIEKNKGT
jgi:hypothetical protein